MDPYKKLWQGLGQRMVTKEELFKLGSEIRANQTFMASALTGENVKLVKSHFHDLKNWTYGFINKKDILRCNSTTWEKES